MYCDLTDSQLQETGLNIPADYFEAFLVCFTNSYSHESLLLEVVENKSRQDLSQAGTSLACATERAASIVVGPAFG